MRRLFHLGWIAAATLCLSMPALAGPIADTLFAEGIFDTLQGGHTMTYKHVRKGAPAPDFTEIADGRITLVTSAPTDDGHSLTLTIEEDGRHREMLDFPASGGNPVLMVFLESTVRSMAAISGGSPFYIRNRVKDALRSDDAATPVKMDFAGHDIDVQQVILRPFLQDPHRDRMGAFADLTLTFLVSDQVPGHFLRLSAETPGEAPSYTEHITLIGGKPAP